MLYNLKHSTSHPPISTVKGDHRSKHEDLIFTGDETLRPLVRRQSPRGALKGGESQTPRPRVQGQGETEVSWTNQLAPALAPDTKPAGFFNSMHVCVCYLSILFPNRLREPAQVISAN